MLRSQRIRTASGGWQYTGKIELICYDCGDDPEADYRKISPLLRRIRGPYPTVQIAREALELHCGRARRTGLTW
jgi:hypothetical protein